MIISALQLRDGYQVILYTFGHRSSATHDLVSSTRGPRESTLQVDYYNIGILLNIDVNPTA